MCKDVKIFLIIVIAFVLLIPASAFGSWHWSSDVEICGDEICKVEKSSHANSMGNHGMMNGMKGNHHMSYMGLCAPGFASLDEICVLDDRCGAGAYPGRLCVMDGVIKEYLRPNHQKFAGISVDNIICLEGKDVMFKHDATPACVNSDSVESLKHRGWSSEKPSIACTMEYAPVCGIDGVTYGNMCGMNAQHMAINHYGECIVSTTTVPSTIVPSTPDCDVDNDGIGCEN